MENAKLNRYGCKDLFDSTGKMLTAIRPPDALVPFRNGTESFSSASPPHYIDDGDGPLPNPEHPDTGRENNHGFEGLTLSEDGQSLWVLLQAATVQEGVSRITFRPCSCLILSCGGKRGGGDIISYSP
jgi:hypothetical protein